MSATVSRSSGIILHPTSLWGPEAVGTLGEEARRWVDFLVEAGQQWWQILPLGPPGPFDSPYMATSAFAGNALLVDLRTVAAAGWLESAPLAEGGPDGAARVDFGAPMAARKGALSEAAAAFVAGASDEERARFEAFKESKSKWLHDYALFTALSEAYGEPWLSWEAPLRLREAAALAEARKTHAARIEEICVQQYWFFEQWTALRSYANERGVRILGDMPIFVALHSAEVWARPDLYHLDEAGNPTVVAGVPPDYFSETGQRWGNPLYNWDAHAAEDYAWWVARMSTTSELCDAVRIDHFRGFESYWEIPAEAETAVDGRWVEGPGRALFDRIKAALGEVPVLAEDLGVITPQVEALRDALGLPGMSVLHFAFGGEADNPYLPHNHRPNSAVYTGTHDNDTTVGWYRSLDGRTAHHLRVYFQTDAGDIAWTLLRAAWRSVAAMAFCPVQDLLSLDSRGRMNTPGHMDANWAFRLRGPLDSDVADRLYEMTELYGRLSE